jgi:hypothetical protein
MTRFSTFSMKTASDAPASAAGLWSICESVGSV